MKKALIIFGVVALTAVAVWYGGIWLQLKRADAAMSDANDAVARANELMSRIRVGDMGASSFTSLENINGASAAVSAALPLLTEARGDAERARDNARRARGLARLPAWYYDYLEKKELIALLRIEQLDRLQQTTTNLSALYGSGPVIFSSVEEMDRLLGQFQAALGMLLSDPAQARTAMDQVVGGMRQVQNRLDAANAEHGFQLLADLSGSVAGNIRLVEQSADLAAATAAGDQAQAQQSAIALEKTLLDTSVTRDFLDIWWSQEIEPLQGDYANLQSRQEELDLEAAAIYARERGT